LSITVKNTGTVPVDVTGGLSVAPGEIAEVPDDAHTGTLLASRNLTKVLHRSRDEVPEGSISDIKSWVGNSKARAQLALEAEQAADEPRSTLVDALTKITSEETS
jgi:hypothetical protein